MTPSKTLFYLCISFIFGIALTSLFKIPQIFVWGIFVLGILIIISTFFVKKNQVLIFGFCVLVFVLGIMRFQISEFNIKNDKLKNFNDNPDKITLIGIVSAEPDIRDNLQKLKITTEKIILNNQELEIRGNMLITLGNYNNYVNYNYLDKVQIIGKLKTPVIFNDFNYKNYLMKDGIYSVMDYPKIEIISQIHQYNFFTYFYEKMLFLKSKLMNSIDVNLSPPQSFVLQGMVFGNDKNMSKELKNQFNITGLSHVTAVSGTNIVIIISMLMVFLLAIGFWRGQAFYGAVIFIWIYILLIGFPASGVRAAIMGCTALLAQKLGRQNTSSRVLILTAVLMLMQNPLLLIYDVGFQLSFLASLGIVHIKPLIDILLKTITKNYFKFITDLIAITLAAQIITLPIIIYNFGRISLIAPITNLLALPVVEALTVLGFLLSVFGSILPISGFIFSIPCWFLLTYFLKILDIFSQPWAVKTVQNISWIWIIIYYVILFFVIKLLQRYQKPKFLGY